LAKQVKTMTATTLRNHLFTPNPATILIVEDDPILRFTLSMELRQGGFQVREACNTDEAETVLEAGSRVNLVVTDIEMPGERDGIALAKTLRAFHPSIRVIVASGTVPDSSIANVADAFFGKPYDMDSLLQRIRALLSDPRQSSRSER
jgi:DNA-binding response OmpR family regulator